MIELVSDGIIPNTHNKTWLIDTVSELSQLEVEFGNEAYCIADRTTYICNGQGNWVEKGSGGGGSSVEVESLNVTENGDYDAGEGKAYNPVSVSVAPLTGTKDISENGTFMASDDGYDGYDTVYVNVPANVKSGKIISENGTYTASSEGYDGYAEVEVAVPSDGAMLFSSEGTIASPGATVTSGNLLQAAIANHHYFELSFEFGDTTFSFPVTFTGGGKAVASRVGVDPVDNVVSIGTIEYVLSNLQLSLDTVFLAQINADGTGFVDMTSILPTSTPATITGYYWG